MATTRTANLETISNEEVSTILATENKLVTDISDAVEKWAAFQKQKSVITIKEAAAKIRALPIKDDGYIVVRDAPDFATLTAKQLSDIALSHKRKLKADLPKWALDTNEKLIKILASLASSLDPTRDMEKVQMAAYTLRFQAWLIAYQRSEDKVKAEALVEQKDQEHRTVVSGLEDAKKVLEDEKTVLVGEKTQLTRQKEQLDLALDDVGDLMRQCANRIEARPGRAPLALMAPPNDGGATA